MTPRFSIVIPAYNHAAYIAQALDSVQGQTCADWELIVIDDASTDTTWAIIESHPLAADSRCRCLRHEANRGAHATLNEGIALARGEWVAILNSDDYFQPERLAVALAALQAEPEVAAVVSDYAYVDAAGQEVAAAASLAVDFPQVRQALGAAAAMLSAQECEVLALLTRNYWHTTSNLICRREVLVALGGFADWRYVHDHDLFLRLAAAYPVRHLPQYLLNYRFHASNTLSESAVRSVGETAAMLAAFLASRPLPVLNQPGPAVVPVLAYLFAHCRLYGGERLAVLLQTLPAASIHPLWQQWLVEAEASTILFDGLQQSVERDRLEQGLRWQEAQTKQWWERAMAAEQLQAEYQWRVQQCTAELEQARENERWQRSQTDKWWLRTVELQADLHRYRRIYACVRWLGIPYLWQLLRRWMR